MGGRTGGSKGGATSAGLVGIDRRSMEWGKKRCKRIQKDTKHERGERKIGGIERNDR